MFCAEKSVVAKCWRRIRSTGGCGRHPPGQPRAQQPARGLPRAGWAPGCPPLHSAAATPHTLSASPDPAFPYTGQSVQKEATQKGCWVRTFKFSESLTPPPVRRRYHSSDVSTWLWELCNVCMLRFKWEGRDSKPNALALVRELYSSFLLQSYKSQKPGC